MKILTEDGNTYQLGRPNLDNPKAANIQTRLTKDEKGLVVAAASKCGMTVAEFLRKSVLYVANQYVGDETCA